MNTLEICLIIIGIICIIVSFIFIPKEETKKNETVEAELSKEQLENITKKIDAMITEQIADVEEKTEITMEKISTKKILELSEYSDTVIAQINKNHEEAMFLYDMLSEKSKEVKKISSELATNVANAANTTKPKQTRTKKNNTAEAVAEVTEVSALEETVKDAENTTEAKPVKKARTSKAKVNISNNNEKILKLHSEGKSIVEIAKALGLGTGEVKLVVDLFKGEM